ncbi:MAG: Ger(x)C family spore germination protein, partial [Thermotaleaceae bacterium]
MKKLLISFFVFIFCTMFLTSCWDRRELNELYIVTALGIDKSEEGYLVTVQLINPGEIESEKSETDTPVTTYQSSGETVFEALRRLTLEAPRRLYGAHLRLVVFGEELAREDGIGKVIDFISRDHEIRTEFYMLVSKNSTAEELLNILTPLERIPANKIISTLEISERVWGSTRRIQLDELVSSLINEGKEPVLTGAIIRGNPDNGGNMKILKKLDVPTAVETRYLAAFKKDKL